MALLNVNLEDLASLRLSYITFLKFIEENVCKKVYTTNPFLEEKNFYSCLQTHIVNVSNFLKRTRRNHPFEKFSFKHTK